LSEEAKIVIDLALTLLQVYTTLAYKRQLPRVLLKAKLYHYKEILATKQAGRLEHFDLPLTYNKP
jgi:hypothetical protein